MDAHGDDLRVPVPVLEVTESGEDDWVVPQPQRGDRLPLRKVPDRFSSRSEYSEVFLALLEQEIAADKAKHDNLTRDDYTIQWAQDEKPIGELVLTSVDGLSIKDILKITDPNNKSARFRIKKIHPDNHSIGIVAEDILSYFVVSDQAIYRMEFMVSSVFFRMQNGLRVFEHGIRINEALISFILGQSIPQQIDLRSIVIDIPAHIPLNQSQQDSVRFALSSPLALISGPPGTGKTATAAAIVYNILKITQEKVLVCAPSNVAVDHLTLNLLNYPGVRPLRIYSRTMLRSDQILLAKDSSLDLKLRSKLSQLVPDLANRVMEPTFDLETLEERYATEVTRAERQIVDESNVICCTCASSCLQYIRSVSFSAVVLDEAGFATEPDSLLPILSGTGRFILLGDVNQLPPMVSSKSAITLGYGRSMFERLMALGMPSHMINIQYRMHPDLAYFSNREIYKNRLENGVSTSDRVMPGLERFWEGEHPITFYHVSGAEESAAGFSYCNHKEAVLIEEILHRLIECQVKPVDIGVITPYEGQRLHILDIIRTKNRVPLDTLEVKNVDGFQGREKNLILLSCVRSNMESEMGFLHNPKRLNVAITRAKFGLVIVGNKTVLQNNKMWRGLIAYFQGLRRVKNGEEILRSLGY